MKTRHARWLALAVAPAAVVGTAIAIPIAAGAAPNLPEKSAAEVLDLIAESKGVAFSGTIVQTSELGLPELPSTSGSSEGLQSSLEFLTGSHEARIFVADEERVRVQVLDRMAERDVIRDGSDVWLYDSKANEATHVTVPDGEATPPAAATPRDVTAPFIDAIDPSTEIVVDENARVAGRDAYVVRLTPDTEDTLVGSVSLSVDAETGLPLGVEILAAGRDDPAFSVRFSDIEFGTPDSALFDFTPPATATVTEVTAPEDRPFPVAQDRDHPEPIVIGEGWGAVVELPVDEAYATGAKSDADFAERLDQLTSPVEGGRALETALVSVLVTDDGRILVGAVPTDQLVEAAGR